VKAFERISYPVAISPGSRSILSLSSNKGGERNATVDATSTSPVLAGRTGCWVPRVRIANVAGIEIPVVTRTSADTWRVQCSTIVRAALLPPDMRGLGELLWEPLIRPGVGEEYLWTPLLTFVHDAGVLKLLHEGFLSPIIGLDLAISKKAE
jgi:hypothetical protein